MKIRLATPEDSAELARLHRQTIRNVNSKDYSKEIIEEWSGRTSAKKFRKQLLTHKRWIALDGEKIIGFCDHSFEGDFGGLYVHKDYIGKGVGTKLIKLTEDSIRKIGRKEIKINSSITAKRFYEKHGFKVVRKSTRKMGNMEIPIYVMRKELN